MALIRFTCPTCQAILKTTDPNLVGKTIRCPKCKGHCPVKAMSSAPPRQAAPRQPASTEPDDEPEEQLEDEKPARKPGKQGQPARSTKRFDFISVLVTLLILAYLAAWTMIYLGMVDWPKT